MGKNIDGAAKVIRVSGFIINSQVMVDGGQQIRQDKSIHEQSSCLSKGNCSARGYR